MPMRPLNAGELPQRGNCYLVELAAPGRVARELMTNFWLDESDCFCRNSVGLD
jgi:hypothetical protein